MRMGNGHARPSEQQLICFLFRSWFVQTLLLRLTIINKYMYKIENCNVMRGPRGWWMWGCLRIICVCTTNFAAHLCFIGAVVIYQLCPYIVAYNASIAALHVSRHVQSRGNSLAIFLWFSFVHTYFLRFSIIVIIIIIIMGFYSYIHSLSYRIYSACSVQARTHLSTFSGFALLNLYIWYVDAVCVHRIDSATHIFNALHITNADHSLLLLRFLHTIYTSCRYMYERNRGIAAHTIATAVTLA